MRSRFSVILLSSCLLAGAAWAQTSSPGGSGGPGGGVTSSPNTVTSPNAPLRLPQQGTATQPDSASRQGAEQSGTGGAANPIQAPASSEATAGPVPPPGAEGSTGGTAQDTTATTGGIGGVNRQPGRASAVPPTSREEDLFIEGEQLEQKARRNMCEGC